MTAYKPGHYKNVALNIVDGTHGFSVSSLNWEVASVIKKQALKPPAKTRMGPVALEIPMWYWAAWGSAALLALIVLGRWVYKKVSRRRRLAQL